jgi:hypothetical protein
MRTLISTFTLSLLVMSPRPIVADERADEATYRKAKALLNDVRTWSDQSKSLLSRAEKAESADEAAELKDRSAKLLNQINTTTDEVHKLMNSIAPPDGSGHALAQIWVFDDLYQIRKDSDGNQVVPSPLTIIECERRLLKVADGSSEANQSQAYLRLARL